MHGRLAKPFWVATREAAGVEKEPQHATTHVIVSARDVYHSNTWVSYFCRHRVVTKRNEKFGMDPQSFGISSLEVLPGVSPSRRSLHKGVLPVITRGIMYSLIIV